MSRTLVLDHYPFDSGKWPDSWVMAAIAHVAKSVTSGFPSGAHNSEGKGVPHIRPMNIDREGRFDLSVIKSVDGETPRLLASGDVLFNNTNSPELIGKTTAILVSSSLAYSNHMTRIRLEQGMNPTFVARQLHFLWMVGYFRHRCKNHVNQASIAAEPLAHTVPLLIPPSDEQIRIADALDELLSDLDAGVLALERVQVKLQHYRSAVLKAAVEGTLTADWRAQHPYTAPASNLLQRIIAERRQRWEESQLEKFTAAGKEPPKNWKAKYEEPIAPEDTALPPLPQGWAVASMDAITCRITSGSRDWQQYYGSGSGTFVMAQNVRPGRLDMTFRQSVNPPALDSSCERSLVACDDLLVTIVGANTGDVCRVSKALSEHYVCQSVALMRPVESATGRFLNTYFNSPEGGQLHFRRYLYGAGRPHLSFDQLKMTPVLLPPLAEQEAIVEAVEDQLSVIEHLEADLDAKLKSAQALRQSILRHAFSGQLVAQDPYDEPASELLRRIAVEREERARAAAIANQVKKKATPAKAKPKTRRNRDVAKPHTERHT